MSTDSRGLDAWVKHTAARDVLGEVLPALADEKIDVLLVKGVVTARELYDDPAERPIMDVDLRVRPGKLAPLRKLLVRLGGEEMPLTSRQWGATTFLFRGMALDVETSIGPPSLAAISVDQMLSRARRVTDWFPVFCLVPEIHDHALLLVINAFKDKLYNCPTASVEDLRRLVIAPEFRPEEFVRRIRAARIVSIAAAVAEWLVLNGSPGWDPIRVLLEPIPRPAFVRRMIQMAERREVGLWDRIDTRAGGDDWLGRASALAFSAAGTCRQRLRRTR